MIERHENVITLTLPDERTAECLENLLRSFQEWTAIGSRWSTPPPSPADTSARPPSDRNPPDPPLRRRGPLNPSTLAASERVLWNKRNLLDFDKINPDPPGEHFLPIHQRPSK